MVQLIAGFGIGDVTEIINGLVIEYNRTQNIKLYAQKINQQRRQTYEKIEMLECMLVIPNLSDSERDRIHLTVLHLFQVLNDDLRAARVTIKQLAKA